MSLPYQVRRMYVSDIPRVLELEALSFATPWSLESFLSELTINPTARYIVLLVEEVIIAYAGIWILLGEGHITNIAVAPSYRSKGFGKTLLRELLKLARCYAVDAVTLEVRDTNQEAICLYLGFGFTVQGIREGYYKDTMEDALIMWKHDMTDISVSQEECSAVYGVKYEDEE